MVKRRVLKTAFPPELVKKLEQSLEETAGSVEELEMLASTSPVLASPPAMGAELLDDPGKGPSRAESARGIAFTTLAASPGPQVPEGRRIFIQYVDTSTAALAEALKLRLATQGHKVPDAELVVDQHLARGNVRYFHEADKQAAEQLKASVEELLKERGVKSGVDFEVVPLAGRYRNVPRGVLEVWLPRL
jgi:hypothetical protein